MKNLPIPTMLTSFIVAISLYMITFVKAYEELRKNWLGVIFMITFIVAIGYIIGRLTEKDEEKNDKK